MQTSSPSKLIIDFFYTEAESIFETKIVRSVYTPNAKIAQLLSNFVIAIDNRFNIDEVKPSYRLVNFTKVFSNTHEIINSFVDLINGNDLHFVQNIDNEVCFTIDTGECFTIDTGECFARTYGNIEAKIPSKLYCEIKNYTNIEKTNDEFFNLLDHWHHKYVLDEENKKIINEAFISKEYPEEQFGLLTLSNYRSDESQRNVLTEYIKSKEEEDSYNKLKTLENECISNLEQYRLVDNDFYQIYLVYLKIVNSLIKSLKERFYKFKPSCLDQSFLNEEEFSKEKLSQFFKLQEVIDIIGNFKKTNDPQNLLKDVSDIEVYFAYQLLTDKNKKEKVLNSIAFGVNTVFSFFNKNGGLGGVKAMGEPPNETLLRINTEDGKGMSEGFGNKTQKIEGKTYDNFK